MPEHSITVDSVSKATIDLLDTMSTPNLDKVWHSYRSEITDRLGEGGVEEAERVALLEIYCRFADLIERRRADDPEGLERLRLARASDYICFMLSEAQASGFHPAAFDRALEREIQAGRFRGDEHHHRTMTDFIMAILDSETGGGGAPFHHAR